MVQYRVLVVDDSSFMRGALTRMIEMDKRFKVIDTAENGEVAVKKILELRPDVVTMDIEMPVMNGIEALKKVIASGSKTPIVMVSTLTEAGAQVTMEALEIGAVDFIPKALNDKDKNIFRGSDVIAEKLVAAVGAGSGQAAQQIQAEAAPKTALPQPKTSVTSRSDIKLIVIGSSTGGPKALQVVLSKLPANLRVPVVVAQHMPANFTKALAKRLDETVPLKVVEASNGDVMVPGTVYIAPGGQHLRMTANGIRVADDKGESPYKPSVDVLAGSIHGVLKSHVLAVMLTGMGNDGTRAFVQLHTDGAHVIAQDQASSVVYGMPKAVLEAGGVDEVLPVEKIGARVAQIVS
ncbi:MAG: chemotaxis response regulator protein-glutamate methylesterase [Alphaproteobacteria bacterium CG_4_10_14_0_8_um_filter_53_9]|nr:MAG: chemotaxis response regulator protein-glutamate methylesterase [Alphaproteobacteria bacterium CG_4_10_14_0_8_um_filter_53_9]